MSVLVVKTGNPAADDWREYPWLGVLEGPGMVVLFSEKDVGTVVATDEDEPDEGFRVGDHDTDWDIDVFNEFDGSVTLANDDVEVIEVDEVEED